MKKNKELRRSNQVSTRASLEYYSILAIVDFDGEGGGENDSGDLN